MNKLKIFGIVFISLLIVIVGYLIIDNNNKKKDKYLYLFTGTNEIVRFYYNDNTWYIVNTNSKLSDYFDVYSNGKFIGNYSLMFNEKWYFLDKNNKNVSIDGVKFMINTNYDFNSYQFETDYLSDDTAISSVAKYINIDYTNYSYNIKKSTIIDNSINDIYFVDFYDSNVDYNSLGPMYTVAFIMKNDKINIIKYLDFSDNTNESCNLQLDGIFTFENKNNKILLSCNHFDQIPSDYYLFENKNNKYNLIVDNS